MRANGWRAVAALATMAGVAMGQNEVIYGVTTPGADVPDLSTAPSLAESETRLVVMGSHRMMMFDKSLPIDPSGPPSLLDDLVWGSGYTGYPFELASSHQPALDIVPGLTFARADYDPIDMMEYTSAYMRGDRRADTDADMVIDAADLANFVDAYDAATGP